MFIFVRIEKKHYMKLLSLAFTFLFGLGLMAQDMGEGIYAKIKTDKGDILLKLEYEKVPMTVASFVALAEGNLKYDTVKISEPYFDGISFHRVVKNFVIQGGDPTGKGNGNPGYMFPDEFDSTLYHDRAGTLSMANSGKNTNGSQFFITHKNTPHLDNKHSVFGYVVSGQEVVDKIEQGDVMNKVEIIRIGKAAKKFKAGKVFVKEVTVRKEAMEAEIAARNKTFYDEVIKKFPTAQQTESGLMYQIIEKGDGAKIESGSAVDVHYLGTFMDGNKFDSSYDRDTPFNVIVDRTSVIKGWHEGLKLGHYGGKIKIILPYWLAYGDHGRGQIPPKASLVFDLEFLPQE